MLKHKELTDIILKNYYDVYNELGFGFLENVYQNSLFFALQEEGLKIVAQRPISVFFRGKEVGKYFADIIVNDVVILELKATSTLCEEHEIQLVNYLKATDIEVGLLLNFGKKPQFERKMWVNDKKNLG
jgi:GxxExxY protein